MTLEYSSKIGNVTGIKYLASGWDKGLEKLPLFMKAEKKNSGKKKATMEHRSVPTSLKHAITFLEDEYKKHEEPGTIAVALCIISGNVMGATCTCAVGKVGYCNHT